MQELPVQQRGDAVSSLVYEANARMRDPVYGCVGAISFLQNQVSQLQMQLAVAQAEILCIQMQRRDDGGGGGGGSDDVDVVVPPSSLVVGAGGGADHHHMTMAMQQQAMTMATDDVDAFLMQNAAGAGAIIPPQLMGMGYGGAASAGAMGETTALKRESLWT
jgi:hypothetical protein